MCIEMYAYISESFVQEQLNERVIALDCTTARDFDFLCDVSYEKHNFFIPFTVHP